MTELFSEFCERRVGLSMPLLDAAEDEAGVLPAEAERVFQHCVDLGVA